MRIDQGRKVNFAGGAGCLSLLLLALVLVNPVVGETASALDEGSADEVIDGGAVAADMDGETMPLATNSMVTVAFSPSSASGSMTPTDAGGAKAKVDVKATVRVQNSGGYKVYVGSNSSQLKNGDNAIESVVSATTYDDLPLNRWGYSFAKGVTAADNYVAMPEVSRGVVLDSNTNTSIADETRTYMLSFAANIGVDKPAGTYTNQAVLSVVSSPLKTAGLTSLANMQDMSSGVCTASLEGDSKQLKDIRDGKYYWVAKLADGKCWMTQNLDLDLSTGTTLMNANTDLNGSVTSYRPLYSTATTASSSTILADDVGQRSWSLGDYRITNPTKSSNCGVTKNSLSQCTSQFTAYATPTTANNDANAHYIVGNHYQWNAATAGTGGTITSGQAISSICPKGWRLPTSTSSGELKRLLDVYSVGADVAKLASSPLYFVRGGYISQNAGFLFDAGGSEGDYWSSTPYSNVSSAYFINFDGTSTVNASRYYNRQYGFSVRCVAR